MGIGRPAARDRIIPGAVTYDRARRWSTLILIFVKSEVMFTVRDMSEDDSIFATSRSNFFDGGDTDLRVRARAPTRVHINNNDNARDNTNKSRQWQ